MAKVPLIPPHLRYSNEIKWKATEWQRVEKDGWHFYWRIPPMTQTKVNEIAHDIAERWNGRSYDVIDERQAFSEKLRRQRRKRLKEQQANGTGGTTGQRVVKVEIRLADEPPSMIIGLREAPDYAALWKNRPRRRRKRQLPLTAPEVS